MVIIVIHGVAGYGDNDMTMMMMSLHHFGSSPEGQLRFPPARPDLSLSSLGVVDVVGCLVRMCRLRRSGSWHCLSGRRLARSPP